MSYELILEDHNDWRDAVHRCPWVVPNARALVFHLAEISVKGRIWTGGSDDEPQPARIVYATTRQIAATLGTSQAWASRWLVWLIDQGLLVRYAHGRPAEPGSQSAAYALTTPHLSRVPERDDKSHLLWFGMGHKTALERTFEKPSRTARQQAEAESRHARRKSSESAPTRSDAQPTRNRVGADSGSDSQPTQSDSQPTQVESAPTQQPQPHPHTEPQAPSPTGVTLPSVATPGGHPVPRPPGPEFLGADELPTEATTATHVDQPEDARRRTGAYAGTGGPRRQLGTKGQIIRPRAEERTFVPDSRD